MNTYILFLSSSDKVLKKQNFTKAILYLSSEHRVWVAATIQ